MVHCKDLLITWPRLHSRSSPHSFGDWNTKDLPMYYLVHVLSYFSFGILLLLLCKHARPGPRRWATACRLFVGWSPNINKVPRPVVSWQAFPLCAQPQSYQSNRPKAFVKLPTPPRLLLASTATSDWLRGGGHWSLWGGHWSCGIGHWSRGRQQWSRERGHWSREVG